MATNTHNSALESLIADLNAAQDRATSDEHGAATLAVHLVEAVLASEGKGANGAKIIGTVTRVSGKGDKRKTTQHKVTINKARLVKYAKGQLTQDEVTETLDALAGVSPVVAAARKEYAELQAMSAVDRKLFAAELDSAKTKAHTLTQTVRRPLRAAAYIFASGMDASTVSAEMSKGSLVIMRDVRVGGVVKRKSLATKAIDEGLANLAAAAGNGKTKRAPQASKANTAKPVDVMNSVTVTPQSFDNGKGNGAQVLHTVTEALGNASRKLDMQTRIEAINLVKTIVDKLNAADRKEFFAEMKKIIAEQS